MYYLFLDESGDHNLIKIDKNYPVFVLAGCIVESNYHNSTFMKEVVNYKIKLFKTNKILIHTADITRNKNGFEELKDDSFRKKFYNETNKLMKKLDFTLIACVIDKVKHLNKYEYPDGPYELSLQCLLERFYYFLFENNSKAMIIAESRDNFLDDRLKLTYTDIEDHGIFYSNSRRIRGKA